MLALLVVVALAGRVCADLGDYYEFETIRPAESHPEGLKPSEWCRFSMERFKEIPTYMRPLMIWMCSRQAGEMKSFRDVGGCMEAVKALCFEQCVDSDEDRDYRECVADASVIAAYRFSEESFHECVDGDAPCLRLTKEWETGSGCWQQCFKTFSEQCFSGCMPVEPESAKGMKYLHCALKMNPAHRAFRNCILERLPMSSLTDLDLVKKRH